MSSPQPPVMRWSTLVTPRGIRNSSLALVVFGLPLTQPLKASHLAGGAVLDRQAEFTTAHLEAALGTGPSEVAAWCLGVSCRVSPAGVQCTQYGNLPGALGAAMGRPGQDGCGAPRV